MSEVDPAVLDWLLAGDPTLRWQVLRDLSEAPKRKWEAERARIQTEGDGARLLAFQDPDGGWGGGLYTPKWISTTFTLLLMRDLGFDSGCPAAARGGEIIRKRVNKTQYEAYGTCTCVVGMWLALGVRFAPGDPVYADMAVHLLTQQLADGGWNCRWPRIKTTHHSSFHTTLNVLDGVRQALEAEVGPQDELENAEGKAIELLLQHRLFRSDRTGSVINSKFKELHFPHRWHYDILRALDYVRFLPQVRDRRLDEAFEVLLSCRRPDGRWAAAKTYGGKVFFNIDPGKDGSRWNTLRALRCLRSRGA
jgi:hypothetical protein